MRGWLAFMASVLVAISCAPTIAPTPPPCTQTKRIIGRPLANDVMLLVDRSTPRLSELKNALQVFATLHPTFGRYGVAVYPHDDACAASGESDVLLHLPDAGSLDLDVDLEAQADQAVFELGTIKSGGRSPLADSLRYVGQLPELQDAHRMAALIVFTGSLPDCTDGGTGDAIAAIAALRHLPDPVLTVLVAFGTDLTDAGSMVAFNALAVAANDPRSCFLGTDQECALVLPDAGSDGGTDAGVNLADTCDQTTHMCRAAFLHANDASELQAALVPFFQPSLADLGGSDCTLLLQWTPATPDDVSLFIDGQPLARCDGGATCDTWQYDSSTRPPRVQLEGETCQQVLETTIFNPVTVGIQIAGCDSTKDPRF